MLHPWVPDLADPKQARSFFALAQSAALVDGQPPFSDQTLVDLRLGVKTALMLGESAAAVFSTPVFSTTSSAASNVSAPSVSQRGLPAAEVEFVIAPDARGRGLGRQLLDEILERIPGEVLIWAHGDHPASRALAASHGFVQVRTLLQLRAPVPAGAPTAAIAADPFRTDSFRVGIDDAEWLRVNALAFAFHPEQSAVSQSDLSQLMLEPWFNADDLLLLRRAAGETGAAGDEQIVGFCWLKVEVDTGIGEFYVVGVDPAAQREGIGQRLMATGLARLAERGCHTAALYVEADNAPAVALYLRLGFTQYSSDIQYARTPKAARN